MSIPRLTRSHVAKRLREVRTKNPDISISLQREKVYERLLQDWKTLYANVDHYAQKASVSNSEELKWAKKYLASFGSEKKDNLRARTRAIFEMGRTDAARDILPYLCFAALRDPSPDNRRLAVNKIAFLKDPESVPLLNSIALREKDLNVRQCAIEGLGKFKDPRVRATLLHLAEKTYDYWPIRSLGFVGDANSARDLFRLFLKERMPLFDRNYVGFDSFRDAILDSITNIGLRENRNIQEALERYNHERVSSAKSAAVNVYILLHPEKYKIPKKFHGDEGPWNLSDEIQILREEAAGMTLESFVKKKGILNKSRK